jgi:HAD superfamily phosphoserine phosphatase-like hydrolase
MKNKKRTLLYKLDNFLQDGTKKLFLISDFDRTLTKSCDKRGRNVTSWEIVRSFLSQEDQKKYVELYKKYRPLELKKILTKNDANIWWGGNLDLIGKNKINFSLITKSVLRKVPGRPYVKELFRLCEKENIPTLIISAGMKNIIKVWCKKFKIKPNFIISTNLVISKNGKIIGWKRESLVNNFNKREKAKKEINKLKSKRPNIVLLGDSLDDAEVVGGDKNVLRIGICDGHFSRREFNKKFDLIVKDGSLRSIVKILKLFKCKN